MQELKLSAEGDMLMWLSHPSELGRPPHKLECAGEFEDNGSTYYIFKFKSSPFSGWKLGISGGSEGADGEHANVGSDHKPYHDKTAESDSRKLLERIKRFKEQKKDAMGRMPSPRAFSGSLLLAEPMWDTRKFLIDLRSHGLSPTVTHHGARSETPSMTVEIEDMSADVRLLPRQMMTGDAMKAAGNSVIDAEGAIAAASTHTGQILINVGPDDNSKPGKRGSLFLMLALSLAESQNGLGLCTCGMILTKPVLASSVSQLVGGSFPVPALVRTASVESAGRRSFYTVGLEQFGRWELEVVDTVLPADEITGLLLNTAGYMIEKDAVLLPGETLGYTQKQRLPLTLSPGINVDGETLKIEV